MGAFAGRSIRRNKNQPTPRPTRSSTKTLPAINPTRELLPLALLADRLPDTVVTGVVPGVDPFVVAALVVAGVIPGVAPLPVAVLCGSGVCVPPAGVVVAVH